jgi:hypothetical protein
MSGRRVAEQLRPSVSTRTEEFAPRDLPLHDHPELPRPSPHVLNPASRRIREALRRWFEEEL